MSLFHVICDKVTFAGDTASVNNLRVLEVTDSTLVVAQKCISVPEEDAYFFC
jgi:hypothetical protein